MTKFICLLLLLPLLLPPVSQATVIGLKSGLGSLNPFIMAGEDDLFFSKQVIETLARTSPESESSLVPVLAKSWRFSPKDKAVVIELREDAIFHNGEALMSEDVKFSLESVYDDKFAAKIWQPMFSGVEKVEVTGPHQIRAILKRWSFEAAQNFLTRLRIYSKRYYEKTLPEHFSRHLVGTGPYKVEAFVPGSSVRLKAWEKWWGGKPRIQSVTIKVVSDLSLAKMMAEKGQLDYYSVPGPLVETVRDVKNTSLRKVRTLRSGARLVVIPNIKNPLFKDREVRKALFLGWNRPALLKSILNADWVEMKPVRPYDPKQSSALLKARGWADGNKDGVLEKVIDGKVTPFAFTLVFESAHTEKFLTLFQEDMSKIGVRVHLKRVEGQNLYSMIMGREVEAIGAISSAKIHIARSDLHSKGEYNYYGFSSPRADTLLDKMDSVFDPNQREEIIRAVTAILVEEISEIDGLMSAVDYYLVSPKIKFKDQDVQRPAAWALE